jgi:hypothetical protein
MLFVESILPITRWNIELASFDIHKITNPEVSGSGYQEGSKKDFYNTKAYILSRDDLSCQSCKKKSVKLHVHHIVFRSNGGTDTPNNLVTLCETCHKKVHAGEMVFRARKSKTKHATEIGIIKSRIKKEFGEFKETYGYETKYKRECVLELPKTHYYDAVAICCEDGETVEFEGNNIVFKKTHIASGDYKQTYGPRSEKRKPTGKVFGFKKFDIIKTPVGVGFVRGKRSSGYFEIMGLNGELIHKSLNIKVGCERITARTSSLVIAVPAIPPTTKVVGFLAANFS